MFIFIVSICLEKYKEKSSFLILLIHDVQKITIYFYENTNLLTSFTVLEEMLSLEITTTIF